MSNPNSFGNSNEIDGQVGMNEWMESNASQEVSSRVGGNLRTISQAQSLELLDSFENEIKEAEGKLNGLDRMRRSREFEMMRDAITARRAELTPNNATEAVSEDISISDEDINDASVDVAETSNYGGIDDRTLADIATSPDVGEESRAAAMREVERRETEGTFDIDNPVYKEGEWSDFDGISDDELLDMATSPDVDPRLSEAAEAELKRRETEAAEESSGEVKDDKAEQIATLEAQLKEVADARRRAKDEGNYGLEASYNSEYAGIVAQIADLKHEATEESSEEVKDDKAEQIATSERDKRNREIFASTLETIGKCEDIEKLDSWKQQLTERFTTLDESVQEKHKEEQEELLRAIDQRKESLESLIVDNDDGENKEEGDGDENEEESDDDAKTGEGSSTENNTDSGEASEDGVNKVPFEEYYLAELEDEYVDELLSHPDYTMQGGIRDRYIRMFKELGDSFYAFVAKLNDSNLDADAKKNKLDKCRSIISEKISDIREKYESEMRGLAGKINALGREVSFGIMNNSDDKNEASAARKGALEEFDSFFAEDESEAADDSDESEESSDNLDDDKEDSDNFVKKVDVLLNPDSFYKSDKGLRALFTGSRSYYDAIETLESAYLEGKTFDEVSSILDTVLSERGEEGKSRVLRKRLKRRYETLGINEDGTLNSEKSEKVSWRKRAANAIRKALKMEVE